MESADVYTKQRRIAELARIHRGLSFTSLAHHIDLQWMREAYRRTRKDGATGVDGVSAEEYAKELAANLSLLLERAKSGAYTAPPVRRVHIPKGDGGKETRPIGVPTFEDKVLQRAVQMVLEPLYEQDFLECSYGFRPGRSAHGAVASLWEKLMGMGGGWIIDPGHPEVLRHDESRSFAGDSQEQGARRGADAADRKVAEGRGVGARPGELPGGG